MFTRLLALVEQKAQYDQSNPRYQGAESYFQGLSDEVAEVKAELLPNNTVYLEDELGDILRDYLNLLTALKQEWKITSIEQVVSRAEKKYAQRLEAVIAQGAKGRTTVKKQQKADLELENQQKYGIQSDF